MSEPALSPALAPAPAPRILLIVGGGVAAYKALELVRRLADVGVAATPVLTRAAQEFVTPLSFAALAGETVHTELFETTAEAEMGHIALSRSADLIVVAPATADLMAKLAQGRADDLATTLLLATDTPVLMAPAMNVRMWTHPATRRNHAQLMEDGVAFVGPDEGGMACGEFGPGRLAEPPAIIERILPLLALKRRGAPAAQPLKGRRILMTSGPTHEPIDPVRYIANRSSGRQGAAIGAALVALGAEVTFVTGPADAAPPAGAEVVAVETAQEMHAAVRDALAPSGPAVDAAIFTAAVADWRPETAADAKLKKTEGAAAPTLSLTPNPDILAEVAALPPGRRPTLVVGFAAETGRLLERARAKRARKGCDWLVANDVTQGPDGAGVMGGDHNSVTLLTESGEERWETATKAAVGRRLAERIADALTAAARAGTTPAKPASHAPGGHAPSGQAPGDKEPGGKEPKPE